MAYKTIHTAIGLQLMAEAQATGKQIRLSHMAVGDGNGNPVTPNEEMNQLVRERFRCTVNRVWQDPDISNKFSAEIVIPASVGGFTLREVGIFDSNGNLFVVGNLPDTYKPNSDDGAYSDTVIRVDFMVKNASIVEMMIDPNVILATHAWIINNITPAELFPGGTTNQVLRKRSNTDGETEWADPTDVNVTVNSIEETQTLAAGQTVIDWSIVNNAGLCVYVDGARLRADQWTKHETINTRITLTQTYSAGTKIIGAQNEPANSFPDPLVKSQNLSDVPDKESARTNLDIYSKSETDQKAPSGAVVYFARYTAPSGWLKANGAAISRTAYADLFAAISTTFGNGDGFNTFNLPDLRGEFIRSWDNGRGVDAGRDFGSFQADEFKAHSHDGVPKNVNDTDRGGLSSLFSVDTNSQTGETGGNETRPRNIALLACIKY